jgi:hypothetical protein
MRPFSKAKSTLALATVLAVLGGCSEYLDRRDTIAKSGGNAVATNVVTQMVDPWPLASAIAPRGMNTSSTYQDAAPAASSPGPVGPATTAPAAPVK